MCEGGEGGEKGRVEERSLLKEGAKLVKNSGAGGCCEGGDGNKW